MLTTEADGEDGEGELSSAIEVMGWMKYSSVCVSLVYKLLKSFPVIPLFSANFPYFYNDLPFFNPSY
jgi:hypothetical protein